MGRIPTLAVNEIFGPTIQGEGVYIGTPCLFLRLAGCNLSCVWCDTPYSWDWKRYDRRKEVEMLTVDDVIHRLHGRAAGIRHLVITGGEPMLQQQTLAQLTKRLHKANWFTEIETAGTITPISTELGKHWNVSPKLKNSENDGRRYNSMALDTLNVAPSKAFKFVVSDLSDFDEIDKMVQRHNLSPVLIMPEGITHDDITATARTITGEAIRRNYRLTTRLHITLYGQTRAV